jgi:hypothetical protein
MAIMAVTLMFCGATVAQDQAAIREQLFGDTDGIKARADALNAVMLAPDSYGDAMALYSEAGADLERGRDLGRVRESLAEASSLFERAVEASELATTTFATTLAARAAAERADAARHADRDWTRAEEAMVEAAEKLEGGNLRGASNDAADVTELYERAELRALNASAEQGAR